MAGVRKERSGKVEWLVLNRPEKLNSLDTATLEEASRLLGEACASDEILLIALRGEGRLFSAGIDLGEVASSKSPEEASRPFRALGALMEAMLDCGKPVVALLNGPAVAGGAELAVTADIAYAVKGAWIQWPEVRWGLIPPMLVSLPLPPQAKARLALAADKIGAEEALSLGLLAGVYDTLEEAVKAVEGLAGLVDEAGPEAVAAILEPLRRPKRQAVELAPRLVALASSMRLVEKARAFIESRR
jgi:enoyl-CoA hydratase/carnithine racemase